MVAPFVLVVLATLYSPVQQAFGHSMRGAKLECPNTCWTGEQIALGGRYSENRYRYQPHDPCLASSWCLASRWLALGLEGPGNLPKANGGTSGKRLSAIESLPKSNYVMSVHLMCL